MSALSDKLLAKAKAKQAEIPVSSPTVDSATSKPPKAKSAVAVAPSTPAAKPAREPDVKFRLPHGARFVCTYDGGKEQWHAELTVNGLCIGHDDTAIHGAIKCLGNRYMKEVMNGQPTA